MAKEELAIECDYRAEAAAQQRMKVCWLSKPLLMTGRTYLNAHAQSLEEGLLVLPNLDGDRNHVCELKREARQMLSHR